MKIARFSVDGRERYGIVDGLSIYEVDGSIFESNPEPLSTGWGLDEVRLLPPCTPTKIVAIGLNYREHAEEFGKSLPDEPMLFLKPSTSVIGHGDRIVYPGHMSRRVDYEGELAVVIKKTARCVPPEEAGKYILGYTCFNDVTARDLQKKDIQYTRAKGFDTFAPIGPWIDTELDPMDTRVRTYLNGEKRQDAPTGDMIFDVYELVSFVSRVMTLLPGDVVATGTPSGVGRLRPGDRVEIVIDGIGSLCNSVGD